MKRVTTAMKRHMERENERYPAHCVAIPKERWPERACFDPFRIAVWRSKEFLVQVFQVPDKPLYRLSVNRTKTNLNGWAAQISWEELQRLKHEVGFGDKDAVEVYPRDADVVNVANMRHLFVFPEGLLEFAWRNFRDERGDKHHGHVDSAAENPQLAARREEPMGRPPLVATAPDQEV